MKTIEEVAKEHSKTRANSAVWQKEIANDFTAGAEFAQRWIPVEEELPETNNYGFSKYVLTKINETFISQKGFANKRGKFIWCDRQPTHWRPIDLK